MAPVTSWLVHVMLLILALPRSFSQGNVTNSILRAIDYKGLNLIIPILSMRFGSISLPVNPHLEGKSQMFHSSSV